MPWWLIVYLVGVPVPLLAVVAYMGWKDGRDERGPDLEEEDVGRLLFPYGVLWPLAAACVVLIAIVGRTAVALGHATRRR